MHRLWTIFEKNVVGKDCVVFVLDVICLHWLFSVLMQVRTRFLHLEGLLGGLSLRLRVLAVKTGAV
jgi:hypothetical protein